RPHLFEAIHFIYVVLLFTTPSIGVSLACSLAYNFTGSAPEDIAQEKLPVYPGAANRNKLFLVIGEVHHAQHFGPAAEPDWLIIPDRGLFTGVIVFGAIGSCMTSRCRSLLPFTRH